jgi:hypothetical protein
MYVLYTKSKQAKMNVMLFEVRVEISLGGMGGD